MIPWLKIAAIAAISALLIGGWYWATGYYVNIGRAEVRKEWDADKALLKAAEDKAIAERSEENRIDKEKQEADKLKISEVFNDELAKVRADLVASKRLRAGRICEGSAGSAKADSPETSDATDTRSGLVPEDIERDINALIYRMEEVSATGRACQSFIKKNGMMPIEE